MVIRNTITSNLNHQGGLGNTNIFYQSSIYLSVSDEIMKLCIQSIATPSIWWTKDIALMF